MPTNIPTIEGELSPLQNVIVNLASAVNNARELSNRLRIINNNLTGVELKIGATPVKDEEETEINGSIDELTRSLLHLNYNLGEITQQVLKLERTI